MDEFSRVRDLAPDATVGEDAVAAARRRLMAQIADTKTPAARRPGAWAIAAARRPRWGMPAGVLAAVAAVVVVALVAAGAVLVAQWMPRPAPSTNEETGTVDLGKPLLDQVPGDGFLRIGVTTDSTFVAEVPTGDGQGVRSADGALRIRTETATYIPADGLPWTTGYPDQPVEVIEQTGPEAQLLVDGDGWRSDPRYLESGAAPAVGREWLADFPSDADGILAAFSTAAGNSEAPTDDDTRRWVAGSMVGHPAWFLLSPEQRADAVEALRSVAGLTVSEQDGEILVAGDAPSPFTTVLDGDTLLPLRGTNAASSYAQDTGDMQLPDSSWIATVTLVDRVPVPEEPEASTDALVRCNGVPIPDAAFGPGSVSTQLDAAGREALNGRSVPTLDPEEWFVVSQTEDLVILMSAVIHQEVLQVDETAGQPTHELLTIRRGDGAWALESWTGCRLEEIIEGLDSADIALDPAFPLTAESTQLHLLVTERACNSGRDAEGRIQLVVLNEFADNIEVQVGIVPPEGAQECPGNPPTPFVVELSAPLGDRPVHSLTYADPTPLRPPR